MPGTTMRGVAVAGGLDPILAKAVLAGLIRHPAEIARHMEVLGSLRSASGALGKLFEAVIDVALEDRQLDSGKVLTILARSGFDSVASDLLRADTLPFLLHPQSGGRSEGARGSERGDRGDGGAARSRCGTRRGNRGAEQGWFGRSVHPSGGAFTEAPGARVAACESDACGRRSFR
jgi:hypothetical protein